jgi:hypothetical protein
MGAPDATSIADRSPHPQPLIARKENTMLPDPTGWPIGGGILAAGFLYAGVSMFATGPIVGERTIAKSDWDAQCAAIIVRDIQSSQPDEPFVPDLTCQSLIAPMLGREGEALCRAYGDDLIPFASQFRERQRQLHDLNQQRLSNAVADVSDRCSCAASYALEDKRVAFAIYAGSLRLIKPPAVKNLASELRAALGAPQCALKG